METWAKPLSWRESKWGQQPARYYLMAPLNRNDRPWTSTGWVNFVEDDVPEFGLVEGNSGHLVEDNEEQTDAPSIEEEPARTAVLFVETSDDLCRQTETTGRDPDPSVGGWNSEFDPTFVYQQHHLPMASFGTKSFSEIGSIHIEPPYEADPPLNEDSILQDMRIYSQTGGIPVPLEYTEVQQAEEYHGEHSPLNPIEHHKNTSRIRLIEEVDDHSPSFPTDNILTADLTISPPITSLHSRLPPPNPSHVLKQLNSSSFEFFTYNQPKKTFPPRYLSKLIPIEDEVSTRSRREIIPPGEKANSVAHNVGNAESEYNPPSTPVVFPGVEI